MRIGVPKEIKSGEGRVAMTPDGVRQLVQFGHEIVVEESAGVISGFDDRAYVDAGAKCVKVSEAWDSDLVVKVKEPLSEEYRYFDGQMIFTFFHFSGSPRALLESLLATGCTAIAYETLEDEAGNLPILQPMSAIAGNAATLMGAYHLAHFNGGNGMQLGLVLGRSFGKVLVVGDGVVGQHAARVALAMGANVVVAGLCSMDWERKAVGMIKQARFIVSTPETISREIIDSDLVVGAVLCKGAKAPKVISEAIVQQMQPHSVIVDVSIDQGGCVETSAVTTHEQPTFIRHGVIHYGVANIPGAYPKTATLALTDVTINYIKLLAQSRLASFWEQPNLAKSILLSEGRIHSDTLVQEFG
jgi:alanine dehydrogenase